MIKYLIGKRISLHGLTEEQLCSTEPYYNWMDDLSLDLFTTRSYFPVSKEGLKAYYKQACSNTNLLLLGIFDNVTNKHIGNITLQNIDWIHQTAFIAFVLGNKDFARKGIVPEAGIMIMYYGFNKLNLERICGGAVEDHPASIRVCEKIGLKAEGKKRKFFKRNGKRYDSIVMGALRDEWMETYSEKAKEIFQELPI